MSSWGEDGSIPGHSRTDGRGARFRRRARGRVLGAAAAVATAAMVALLPGVAGAVSSTSTTTAPGTTPADQSVVAQASAAAGVPLPPIPNVPKVDTDGQDPGALLGRAIALLTAGDKAVPLQANLAGLQSSVDADTIHATQAGEAAKDAGVRARAAATSADQLTASARSLTAALQQATLTLYMTGQPNIQPDYHAGNTDAVMAAVIGEQVALSPQGILAERRRAAANAQVAAVQARAEQAQADADAAQAGVAELAATDQATTMQTELSTLGAATAKTLQTESAALSGQAGTDLTSASALQFTPTTPVPPPVTTAPVALTWLFSELGKSYVYGATGPNTFDCSGLTQFVWNKAGVSIPRVAADQYNYTVPIPLSNLRPGDLVFYVGSDGSTASPGHVGMYIGGGLMINAPYTGTVVQVSSIWFSDLIGFGRVHMPGVPVASRAPIVASTPAVVSALGAVPSQNGPPPGVAPVTEPVTAPPTAPATVPTTTVPAPTTSTTKAPTTSTSSTTAAK